MTRSTPLSVRRCVRRLALLGLAPLSAAPASASITGVCPDGSVFIVQHPSAVPCRDAKTVDPQDVPPIKPEYLPRPYGWEVLARRNDPNNPYNMVESRTAVRPEPTHRAAVRPEPAPVEQRVEASEAFRSEPRAGAVGANREAAAGPSAGFGLSDSELADLVRIVELSQRRAPAWIESGAGGGRLQVARSRAFETRARAALGRDAETGPVVLFAVDTQDAGAFHANLTFVQGHVAYQPMSDDPSQLGLLRGETPLLGYVVLPDRFDLGSPIDIYWNDQRTSATLAPSS